MGTADCNKGKTMKKIRKFMYRLKKWYRSNLSQYNAEYNRQCAYGVRGKGSWYKCRNRWKPMKCGRCWRASMLDLHREEQ